MNHVPSTLLPLWHRAAVMCASCNNRTRSMLQSVSRQASGLKSHKPPAFVQHFSEDGSESNPVSNSSSEWPASGRSKSPTVQAYGTPPSGSCSSQISQVLGRVASASDVNGEVRRGHNMTGVVLKMASTVYGSGIC